MVKVKCYICEAEFTRERGCVLEKRCHACQILKLGSRDVMPYVIGVLPSHEWILSYYNYFLTPYDIQKIKFNTVNIPCYDDGLDIILNKEDVSKCLNRLLSTLNNREETVLRLLYGLTDSGDDYTRSEIARLMNCSSTLISTIALSAFKKLKHSKTIRQLKANGYFETFGYFNFLKSYNKTSKVTLDS